MSEEESSPIDIIPVRDRVRKLEQNAECEQFSRTWKENIVISTESEGEKCQSPSVLSPQKPSTLPKPNFDLSAYIQKNNLSTISSSVGDESNEELLDVSLKLKMVANELVHTEETYLSVLNLLVSDFPKALHTKSFTNAQPNVDTVKCVLRIAELEPIMAFHAEHLFPQLKKRLETWELHPYISDIILKSVGFFKMYSSFVVGQDMVVEEFNKLMAFHPELKKVVEEFILKISSEERYSAIKNKIAFRFEELLCAPFSRLFQYKTLLERFVKIIEKEEDPTSNKRFQLDEAAKAVAEMDKVHILFKYSTHCRIC